LAENHYLHLVERAKVEGVEYLITRRVARPCGVLFANKLGEPTKIGRIKFTLEFFSPRGGYLYLHTLFYWRRYDFVSIFAVTAGMFCFVDLMPFLLTLGDNALPSLGKILPLQLYS